MMVDENIETIRLFRVEQTYAVKTGKWYFEFEAFSGGDMRVGWARPCCRPDVELGADDQAFVFDGYRVNSSSQSFSSLPHDGCMSTRRGDEDLYDSLNSTILFFCKILLSHY